MIKLASMYTILILFTSCMNHFSILEENGNVLLVEQYLIEPNYVYIISEDKEMKIYELDFHQDKKSNYKERVTQRYCRKLNSQEWSRLESFLLPTLALDTQYLKNALDGVAWDVRINYNNEVKSIYLFNKTVPEIDNVFNFINSLIPKDKPRIIEPWLDK